jgi:hypothetical protein
MRQLKCRAHVTKVQKPFALSDSIIQFETKLGGRYQKKSAPLEDKLRLERSDTWVTVVPDIGDALEGVFGHG